MTPKRALITATAAVLALSGGTALVAQATAPSAAVPVPTCVKPTSATHAQQVTFAECNQKRTEALLTNLHPVPTVTETVTVTATATVTVTASPSASPTPSSTPTPTSTPTEPPSGEFPTPDNTGVPAGTTLTPYMGPCYITTPNVVITAKTINCDEFQVETTGVIVRDSLINGIVRVGTQDDFGTTGPGSDPNGTAPIRLTMTNVEIDGSAASGHGFRALQYSHYILRNSYVHGGGSGADCQNACLIENSYIEAFGEHESGMKILRNGTLRGNTIWCKPNPSSDDDGDGQPDPDGGCSGNLTMYSEFGVPHHNVIEGNYFPAGWFWYSLKFNGYDNGNLRIAGNTFGIPKSGAYLADGWDPKPTNVWSGNVLTNGAVASP